MKSKNKLARLAPIIKTNKIQWQAVNREKYFVGENTYFDEVLVTTFPCPSNLPFGSISYKTIDGGYLFAFRYDLTDQEPQYTVNNRYGNFLLGVNSHKIIEAVFHTKECMFSWINQTRFSSQSNENIIKQMIIENSVGL